MCSSIVRPGAGCGGGGADEGKDKDAGLDADKAAGGRPNDGDGASRAATSS